MLDRLRAQHAEIGRLTDAFVTMIDDPGADVGAAGELRWELCRKLLDHIADEDRLVCDRLIATGNAEAIAKTMDFRTDLGALSIEILRYRGEWPLNRVREEWPHFCTASRTMLTRIGRRVDREEEDLYPLAQRLVYGAAATSA